MKNPHLSGVTRASLLSSASSTRYVAGLVAGIAATGANAADPSTWTGTVSSDWNNPANWNNNLVPVKGPGAGDEHALVDNSLNTPFYPIITASLPSPPQDIFVGRGAGNSARLDQTAGTVTTGDNNWAFVGRDDATASGIYNLCNTAGTGGTLTGFGQGSGTFISGFPSTANGRMYVGAPGTGVLNVHTTGALDIRDDFWIGQDGGNGTVNIDSGTCSAGTSADACWVGVGSTGGTGIFNMAGGSFTSYGTFWVPRDGGSTGTVNLTGGTLAVSNFGEGVVLAQGGGTGTVNHANGAVVNLGTFPLEVGRDGGGTATYVLTNSPLTCDRILLASNGGAVGNLTCSGGTITTGKFDAGAGTANVSFNGTTVNAIRDENNFLADIADVTLDTNGVVINTAGFNLRGNSPITGTSDGGITVNGGGSLNLAGAANNLSYDGPNVVNAGRLTLPGDPVGFGDSPGDITLADDPSVTTLGVTAQVAGDQLGAGNVTFGGATNGNGFNANLGDINFTLPTDALLRVNGTLTVAGALTVNVTVTNPTTGKIPLIRYSGAFPGATPTIGSLPNGVAANIVVDDAYFGAGDGAVLLDIVSVALPDWTGTDAAVVGPITGDLLAGDPVVLVAGPTAAGIVVGQTVSGTGIPDGTTVTAVSDGLGEITLSNNCTATNPTANLCFAVLPGSNDGEWDNGTTQNWIDQAAAGAASVFNSPAPVVFNDKGLVPNVTVDDTVLPSDVLINNVDRGYAFGTTAAGKISGATGVTKRGGGTAAMNLSGNDFTGATRVEAGILQVPTLSNSGVPSAIGAGTSIEFAGGTLEYTGPNTSISRPFSVLGLDSGLSCSADVIATGPVTPGLGSSFRKTGTGNLTFDTTGAANTYSAGPIPGGEGGLVVDGGTLTLTGVNTHTVDGEVQVGTLPDVAAHLVFSNTTFTTNNWLAVSRGNGDTGVNSTLTATSSTVSVGNLSCGFDAGLANNVQTNITLTDTTWTNTGVSFLAESSGSAANVLLTNSDYSGAGNMHLGINADTSCDVTLVGDSTITCNRFLMALGNNSVTSLTIQDTAALNKTGGSWMSYGNGGTGSATVTVRNSGKITNANGDFNISDVDSASGTLNVEDSATVTSLDPDNNNQLFIGKGNGDTSACTGILNQTGASTVVDIATGVNMAFRGVATTGELNVSAGLFKMATAGMGNELAVGDQGDAEINVSGTGTVDAQGARVRLALTANAFGTVNLGTGGTLMAKEVRELGGGGTSDVNFDGGTLIATASSATFLVADSGTVSANNGTIDTGANIVTSSTPFSGAGTIIKAGSGTLNVDSTNTNTGGINVTAGTLGGVGSTGPVTVASGASVAPGASAGTLTTGTTTIAAGGSYACEIDGIGSDTLAVEGNLTITGATLAITEISPALSSAYVIATYTGTRTGTFSTVTFNGGALPGGWSIDYGTANQIILKTTLVSAYETWAMSFGLDPLTDGAPDADADNNGQSNKVEFVFFGNPVDGEDNAKIYIFAADSDADTDADPELLMTGLIRDGGDGAGGDPVFSGNPLTGAVDGLSLGIQGTLGNLGAFAATVTEATTPVTTGLPTAPAGAEYRTWSLGGSNNFPGSGFLRADVNP